MKRIPTLLGLSTVLLTTALVPLVHAQTASTPTEVISPITDSVLAPRTSNAEARKQGRFVYDKPTPENTVLLLIDHQIGLMAGVRDFSSLAEYKNNVVGLAKMAKALNIPVIITSSNAQWQNGDTLPELKALFPKEAIIRRTGIINAYEDPTFRAALEAVVQKSGRKHILIALGAELQADWKKPSATAMLAPFRENLPEYGFVLDNFWNNYGQKVVTDPFKK